MASRQERVVARNREIKVKKSKKKKNRPQTVEEFLKVANKCIDQLDFETAVENFTLALELQPENTAIMDVLGGVFIELGDEQKAEEILRKSTELAPEDGWSKWMNLGQIYSGQDSLHCYQKGVELITAVIEGKVDEEMDDSEFETVKLEMASALCSIAELYMTDLCFETNAEEQCGKVLEQAISISPDNPEVCQICASYRISQSNQEDARKMLQRVIELIEPLEEEMLPPFDFRLTTTKLLIEAEMESQAVSIVDQLLCEDDSHLELLYLAAIVMLKSGEPEVASEHIARAMQLLERSREEAIQEDCFTQDMEQDIQEQIDQLTSLMQQVESSLQNQTNDQDEECNEDDNT